MLIDETRPRYTLLSAIRGVLVLAVLGGLGYAVASYIQSSPDSPPLEVDLGLPVLDAMPPIPDAAPLPPLQTFEGELRRSQSLVTALAEHGVPPQQTNLAVAALKGHYDFRYARPGSPYRVTLRTADQRLVDFHFQHSTLTALEVKLVDDELVAKKVQIPTRREQRSLHGKVNFTLGQAMGDLDAPAGLVGAFTEAFAWDFDFQKQTRPGDRFTAIYEQIYKDEGKGRGDEPLGMGNLLAAEYVSQFGTHRVFWFEPADGKLPGNYYLEDGRSVRRTMLATPLKYTRISSGWDLKRKHPVLGYTKAHLGIDFAAPIGTPVWSMADGVVTYAGFKGANGNLVVIKHDDGVYSSIYAHLHRFGPGIKRGVRVQQKQVIGQVGTTGRSTGPHLHFGVKKYGRYIDPATLEVKRGEPLPDRYQVTFGALVEQRTEELEVAARRPL